LSICIAHRRVYTPLMRFSSLTIAVDHTAAMYKGPHFP